MGSDDRIGQIFGIESNIGELPDGDRKAIRGWCYYDWAKSAFETSIVVAILPVYFVTLFKYAYGTEITLAGFTFTGDSMWAWATFLSAIIIALVGPGMGVIADRAEIKMKLTKYLTWLGAGATVMLAGAYFLSSHWGFIWLFVFYVLANMGLLSATIFYNAMLPYLGERASADYQVAHRGGPVQMDDISNRAFAYGYLGGGILLAIHLAIVTILVDADGNLLSWVVPVALASSGLWWYGFALITINWVPEPHIENPVRDLTFGSATRLALTEVRKTLGEVSRFKVLALYIVAYFFFIDGINSVTALAGAFGASVLGIPLALNMAVILIVQFVAAPSAMLFTRLAGSTSTKTALTAALVGWCVVIFGAVGFAPLELQEHEEYDFQLDSANGDYEVTALGTVWLGDSDTDTVFYDAWQDILPLDEEGEISSDVTGTASEAQATAFLAAIDGDGRFSASVSGGNLTDRTALGKDHPTSLGDGAVDAFPVFLRDNFWAPLGFGISIQWLFLGLMAGTLLGGSQGLARSIFGQMVPQTRSAEFFGFFGFFGRVAAFLGPLIYVVVTGLLDSRTAILSLGALVVIGAVLLQRIDVAEGIRVARAEDERKRGNTE
ncbi:MAG: MFS transporter [Candidatus Poseidoniia archaeon]|nr:MFS transporter [Candidatus Poseidoniia archaeon]